MMVIRTVRSESCQYNLNGKETMGLGCPCSTALEFCHLACVWGPKLQFSVSFCSAWLWKIVSDECYKSCIHNDSFIGFYASFLYNQMSTCHVLIPYQYFYIPLILLCCLALLIPFTSAFSSPLCSYCWFLQILLHLVPSPFSPLLLQLSSVPPASYSFVWSPASYPQHIRRSANESGESEGGRTWCRTRRTGFNEAGLNEFTACHWTAPSRVAGLAPRPLCQKASSPLSYLFVWHLL